MIDTAGHRAEKVLRLLAAFYRVDPRSQHTRRSPFQVLIGTVLSQRTRDEKTGAAAEALLSRYPSHDTLATAPVEDITALIRPVNYYKTKARRIQEICRILVKEYPGGIPDSIAALTRLPGVGRKTACCVLLFGFGKRALPVDTHVHRISNRLGLIRTKTPQESEEHLMKLLPEHWITSYNQLMVKHGQSVCRPIGPLCGTCPVVQLCAYGSDEKRSG
jgi:endonuclease-3